MGWIGGDLGTSTPRCRRARAREYNCQNSWCSRKGAKKIYRETIEAQRLALAILRAHTCSLHNSFFLLCRSFSLISWTSGGFGKKSDDCTSRTNGCGCKRCCTVCCRNTKVKSSVV